jgi:hypothetical protein
MDTNYRLFRCLFAIAAVAVLNPARASVTLTNPILFVTQVQIPKEANGNIITNTFVSVVSLFGNHLADTIHAGRGGDLMLMTTNQGLVNLTRKAGLGTNGSQDGIGIAVRDPAVHWGGKKAIFSMVVGAPTGSNDPSVFYWQLYELTNLDLVIANTNTPPLIVRVPNQPTNFNNVSPCYATDDRIIFMTDKPFNGAIHLYPQLEEYKGNPSVSGTWSLNPTNGDLRILNHTPSGAFNPIVDSFGRIIESRWDHLTQDPNATNDRLFIQTNGSFNYLSETNNAPIGPIIQETFPEPRNFDGPGLGLSKTHGNAFNNFLPWMLPEAGGAEEILNHVGRHELFQIMQNSFTNDNNLLSFSDLATRNATGVVSANTNFLNNFFQITEDPRNPGTYFGVDAPDFGAAGGTHTAGRILALTGPPSLNPTGMVVIKITSPTFASLALPLAYRNPLPMSDGKLIAAVTPATNTFDVNLGTDAFPNSFYRFRLMLLTNTGGVSLYSTNQFLIPAGLTNDVSYWAGATRVRQTNGFWELQPVEVRARNNPGPWNPGVAPIEQAVFASENVDLPTFQADLAARGLALVVSRNVTARDAADKQQPYNLDVPGGVTNIANGGKVYDITHLQFLQADYLRGYALDPSNAVPGRRVLATPMHDSTAFNYNSTRPVPPLGGTQLMPDGSQATIVPANRAMTWQLTGSTNESVVKERYWITFRPGEVRTCANCHGINDKDQSGHGSPTNAPQALQQLLRLWRTNAANAYSLIVSNGSGGGNYGAGSVLTLTANPTPSGKLFAGWVGAGISNAAQPATFFTMPTSATTVAATYTNLPPPVFNGWQLNGGTNVSVTAHAYPSHAWVLQISPDLITWINALTNNSDVGGVLQMSIPVSSGTPIQFFRLKAP